MVMTTVVNKRKEKMIKSFNWKSPIEFFSSIKSEANKISWTSREELWVKTKVVAISTVFIGVLLFMTDLLVRGSLSGINSIVKLVTG